MRTSATPPRLRSPDTAAELTARPRAGPRPRLLMWVALAVALIALPLLSLPGRYVFDTRDALWLSPAAYMSKALVLWRSSPFLGLQQHDGIFVPMGLAVWGLHAALLPTWVAERLWHGLLLFTSAATTILLVDELRGRRTILAPLVAGLAYCLTPYTFAYGLQFSAVYLPYALLPALLVVTLRGLRERDLLWPAVFGLITFLMGGGNGAPQAYVLATVAALAVWSTFVEHDALPRQAARFGLWCAAFFIGVNAFWLVLLGSTEVGNALAFSEQPATINITSNIAESIRGLGFWQFYGGDRFGPWIPAVVPYLTSVPVILAGYALPLAAIVSAWLTRWRYRTFFVALAIVSVFVASGIYPPASPSPFGHALLWAYGHVPGAAGLRTTYKATAEASLSIAVLVAFGVEALWARIGRVRATVALKAGMVLALSAVLWFNATPLVTGHLYDASHGLGAVPGYWTQALSALDRRDVGSRAIFLPSTGWGEYRWGAIKEGLVASDPSLSSVNPARFPVGQRYGSNLLAALEQPYLAGLPVTGTSTLLRYLGVRDVVLQNDLDWQRSHTARPARLQALRGDRGLAPLAMFGRIGQNTTGPTVFGAPDRVTALERSLHPVQILTVTDPRRILRAEPAAPIVLSGDGFGLAEAARSSVLRGGRPILYSGMLTTGELEALLRAGGASFVITDTNRREVWSFTGPRAPHSYTLPAGQTLQGRETGYQLFGGRTDAQSVAVYPGLRSITASGEGAPTTTSGADRPANAFDGDPSTSWRIGPGRDPVGSWVQATFERPTQVSQVALTFPPAASPSEVLGVRVELSNGYRRIARVGLGGPWTVRFPSQRTTFVRLRILSVGRGTGPVPSSPAASGAAISDIAIPGLDAAELIQTPTDLFDLARTAPGGLASLRGASITYLFERAPDGEELALRRRFEVPATAAYRLLGTVHLSRFATDAQIDDALGGPSPVEVISSSRLLGNPNVRASAAFDGNPGTNWIAGGAVGEWVQARFPARTVDHVVIDTANGPGFERIDRVRATFSDGSAVTGSPDSLSSGVITLAFSPKRVSSLRVTVDGVLNPLGSSSARVGIDEIRIPGLAVPQPDPASPAPCSAAFGVTLDRVAVRVQPQGTIGQLLQGNDLQLRTCGDRARVLTAGPHDLTVGGALQTDGIRLTSGPPRRSVPATPRVSAAARADGGSRVRVEDASGPFYLTIGQNWDDGWRASIGGHDLGPPLLLDGYSAGWLIDRAGSYEVVVRYGPQSRYVLAVGLTALSVAAAVATIVIGLVRRRRRALGRRRGTALATASR